MNRHLFSIKELSSTELQELVDRTIQMGQSESHAGLLAQKNVGLYFKLPSTRTKTSYTLAASNLGASMVTYHPDELQLVTGETIEDTARILGEYLDVLVIRCHHIDEVRMFAEPNKMSVINASTVEEHPSQIIGDLAAIKERFNRLESIKILFIGEGGDIATSLLFAGSKAPGMELHFLMPPEYSLNKEVLNDAEELYRESSSTFKIHHDPQRFLDKVDVIYTTRWRRMGDEPSPDWREAFKGFQVTTELLNRMSASSSTIFMHDLPAERGAEVDGNVLDDARSIIDQQARNKYTSAKALLAWCLSS